MKRYLIYLTMTIMVLFVFSFSMVQANELVNGGFEDSDMAGWLGEVDMSQGGYWLWDHDQHSGSYAAATGSWSQDLTPSSISQEVTVCEGDKVVFSAWTSGQHDFAFNSTACLKLEFLDAYGNIVSSCKSDVRSGVYSYVKDTVKGAAPAESNIVRCIFYVESEGGTATFDDAKVFIK